MSIYRFLPSLGEYHLTYLVFQWNRPGLVQDRSVECLLPGTLSVSFTFNLGLDNISGLQSFLRGLPPTVWSGWRLNSPQPSSGKCLLYPATPWGSSWINSSSLEFGSVFFFSLSPFMMRCDLFHSTWRSLLINFKDSKKKENHLAVFLIQESQQTLTSMESHRHFHMEFTLPLSERKNAEAEGGVGMRARNRCQHELWSSGLQMYSLWVPCSPWRRGVARACLCC